MNLMTSERQAEIVAAIARADELNDGFPTEGAREWIAAQVTRLSAALTSERAAREKAEAGCPLCHCCGDAPGRHEEIVETRVAERDAARAERDALRETVRRTCVLVGRWTALAGRDPGAVFTNEALSTCSRELDAALRGGKEE